MAIISTCLSLLPSAVCMSEAVEIATFYRFTARAARGACARGCTSCAGVPLGTVLIASEGINAILCGTILARRCASTCWPGSNNSRGWPICRCAKPTLHAQARAIPAPACEAAPRDRQLLASMTWTLPPTPASTCRPAHWDELIQREDVRVIDTRNDYEVALGRFSGKYRSAHDAILSRFARLCGARAGSAARPPCGHVLHRPFARSSPATGCGSNPGFAHVYQLAGGILKVSGRFPAAIELAGASVLV